MFSSMGSGTSLEDFFQSGNFHTAGPENVVSLLADKGSGGLNFRNIPAPTKKKVGLPGPPPQPAKPQIPPPKMRNFVDMEGFCSRKSPKIRGLTLIGKSISGPRIAGGKSTDVWLFLITSITTSSLHMSPLFPYPQI